MWQHPQKEAHVCVCSLTRSPDSLQYTNITILDKTVEARLDEVTRYKRNMDL